MKKAMIYIVSLLLVTIVTVSGTYAYFFVSDFGTTDTLQTHDLKVLYSGDTEIEGYIDLVKTKEEGFRRTVSIALVEGSIDAVGNLYVYLDKIDAGFASVAMKWEIYGLNGTQETFIAKGTFDGYNDGEKVYMLKGIDLNTTVKEYAIYLWLNGYEAGNEVVGAILRGYIGAETEAITGSMS